MTPQELYAFAREQFEQGSDAAARPKAVSSIAPIFPEENKVINKRFVEMIDGKPLYEIVELEQLGEVFDFYSQALSQKISDRIKLLRESGFTFVRDDQDQRVLIKYHPITQEQYNPIQPHEAEVQALRYLQAMLLIQKNSSSNNSKMQKNFSDDIKRAFADYQKRSNSRSADAAINTRRLVEAFAEVLVKSLGITLDSARKQVTMARDLAILLEEQPRICTITESYKPESTHKQIQVTVETSEQYKVSSAYYAEFENLAKQPWFQMAEKSAGFPVTEPKTWLHSFFENNLASLRERGVPAPPSARWLPLPANNQNVRIVVSDLKPINTLGAAKRADFMRMGVAVAYDIKSISEQERLAKLQIKEIVHNKIEAGIDEYKRLNAWRSMSNPTFIISYQTLLTPHFIEALAYSFHKDNNAKFVEMVKAAMSELGDEYQLRRPDGVQVLLMHTNNSINKRADWISAKEFENDVNVRIFKINEVAKVMENLANLQSESSPTTAVALNEMANVLRHPTRDQSPETLFVNQNKIECLASQVENGSVAKINSSVESCQELATRMRAAYYLRLIVDKQEPYKDLNAYQRNIMMSALEYHCLGSQAFTLAGCKSARDRTATFAAAAKTMLENPKTMHDWEALSDGMVRSLKQGHHFRSMIYHTAIVKVGMVHQFFMKKLPQDVQRSIISLLPFSKKLGAVPTKVIANSPVEAGLKHLDNEMPKLRLILRNIKKNLSVLNKSPDENIVLQQEIARDINQARELKNNKLMPQIANVEKLILEKLSKRNVVLFNNYLREIRMVRLDKLDELLPPLDKKLREALDGMIGGALASNFFECVRQLSRVDSVLEQHAKELKTSSETDHLRKFP